MFPSSLVASPVFAAVWSIAFLRAVRAADAPSLASSPVALHYDSSVIETLGLLRDLLRTRCNFSPEIAQMLLDEWHADDDLARCWTQADVRTTVAAALGQFGSRMPETSRGDRELADAAARNQLAALLAALLVVQRSAELEGRPFESDAYVDVLRIAHELAGPPSPFTKLATTEVVRCAAWEALRSIASLGADLREDMTSWLRTRLEELAGNGLAP